jgi:hypothetical protein
MGAFLMLIGIYNSATLVSAKVYALEEDKK